MEKEYWDCEDCGKIIEKMGDDDFHFEVDNRENINVPKPHAITVCGDCWSTKGYREEYEKQFDEKYGF